MLYFVQLISVLEFLIVQRKGCCSRLLWCSIIAYIIVIVNFNFYISLLSNFKWSHYSLLLFVFHVGWCFFYLELFSTGGKWQLVCDFEISYWYRLMEAVMQFVFCLFIFSALLDWVLGFWNDDSNFRINDLIQYCVFTICLVFVF